MPNYDQPVTSAREASEAVRALTHATTRFGDNPADTFDVLGDVLRIAALASEILQNLAEVHVRHAARAIDDDRHDAASGREIAESTARYLREASREVASAYTSTDRALATTSRIIWRADRGAREPGRSARAVPEPPRPARASADGLSL